MSLPIVVSALAKADVASIRTYIASDSFDAASRFLDALQDAYEMAAEWPLSGKAIKGPDNRMTTIRGFSNYLVIWRVRKDHVEIIRVFHGHVDRERIMRTIRP